MVSSPFVPRPTTLYSPCSFFFIVFQSALIDLDNFGGFENFINNKSNIFWSNFVKNEYYNKLDDILELEKYSFVMINDLYSEFSLNLFEEDL
mgnify:CR=1 FL=1